MPLLLAVLLAAACGDEPRAPATGSVIDVAPAADDPPARRPRRGSGDPILPPVPVDPPFGGTTFIDPDILTPDDPTAFASLTPAGRGTRTMFDRRVNDWIRVEAHLFDARFSDGLNAEVQVNPEFDGAEAAEVAEKFAREIGRLPTALRTGLETVWIHQGTEPFGGGNDNILIHVGQADLYEGDGFLHETLLHEATHTSLDPSHARSAGWTAARTADGNFISEYARDFPDREDLAETFVVWFAVRHARDRIAESLYDTIFATIPHRIAYLDALRLQTSSPSLTRPRPKMPRP